MTPAAQTAIGKKTGGYKLHAKGSKKAPQGGFVVPSCVQNDHAGKMFVFDFFHYRKTGNREVLFVLKDTVS